MKRVVASSVGALHERVVERGGDAVDVERLVAGRQAMSKPLPRLSSGSGMPIASAISPALRDGHAVDFGQRLGVEALRAGEHVQAAPVDAGLDAGPGRATGTRSASTPNGLGRAADA